MDYIADGFARALRIILTCDREFLRIVQVSVLVAGISTLLASLTGVSFGIFVAQNRFRGRRGL